MQETSQLQKLLAAKFVHSRVKERLDKASSGKPGTARVELHLNIDDVRVLVHLAGVSLDLYERKLEAAELAR